MYRVRIVVDRAGKGCRCYSVIGMAVYGYGDLVLEYSVWFLVVWVTGAHFHDRIQEWNGDLSLQYVCTYSNLGFILG